MKTILSSAKRHYIAGVSIFLIVVGLIVGMVGCEPTPVQYDLTISSSAGGSVTKPGEGTFTYSAGTVVDLVAMPEEGYSFVEWTGDVHSIDNADAAVTHIIMNDDYDIEASHYCEYCPFPSPCLNTSSTDCGEVCEPGEGSFVYDTVTLVDLVAKPFEGCAFEYWTGDVDTIADVWAASTTITMNGNYSITANFVAIYDLTIASTEGGSVMTPGEGMFTYDEGTVVNLVAQAEQGYDLVNWSGDVDTIADVWAASTAITMSGNYSITANFVP